MILKVSILRKCCLGLVVVGFGLITTACTSTGNPSSNGSAASEKSAGYQVSEQDLNKLVVMKYMEAYSTSLRSTVETELLSPGFQELRKEFANIAYHAAGSQLAGIADPMNLAISKRRNSVEYYIAEDDMVVIKYRITGTHAGNFYGIPATDKKIDVLSGAVFWLENGKITKSWFMADEAGFLRQVGMPLPARADGRWEAAPVHLPTQHGDDLMTELMANPVDSLEYLNKLKITAWKAPAYKEQYFPEGRGGRNFLRSGFQHIVQVASDENKEKYPFSAAFPDRVDRIAAMVSDGKRVVVLFNLTATNSVSLVGIPAQNRQIAAWEFGYQEFDGEVWNFHTWFGDDLGMLLQMGGSQDHWFQGS